MPPDAQTAPEIVTTSADLAAVCERLSAQGRFAFDTEFVAEDTYVRHICLIQAATESFCVLIDPMDGLDLEPFWSLVTSEHIEKVVHSGSEDVAICWQQCDRAPANLFDTQVAAGLVGFGYPLSLARLVRIAAGTRLHKSQTLTDWRRRPLTDAQIKYAVEDVIHLPKAGGVLQGKLAAAGRMPWLQEECAKLCVQPARQDARHKLRRLRGTGSLGRRELAIAEVLLDERDKLAQEYDRPPRTLLRDHLLVELARHGWTDPAKIKGLRGINLRNATVERLARAVDRARRLPKEQWPELPPSQEDSPEQDALADLLIAVLRDHCNKSGIAMSLLAARQDVRAVVRSHGIDTKENAPSSLSAGWRREAVGELVDAILSGRLSVRVDPEDGDHRLRLE